MLSLKTTRLDCIKQGKSVVRTGPNSRTQRILSFKNYFLIKISTHDGLLNLTKIPCSYTLAMLFYK